MKLLKRNMRLYIDLHNGMTTSQRLSVEARDEAEFDRISRAFAQGMLSTLVLIPEEEIINVHAGWEE
jgi:hypothetical protein